MKKNPMLEGTFSNVLANDQTEEERMSALREAIRVAKNPPPPQAERRIVPPWLYSMARNLKIIPIVLGLLGFHVEDSPPPADMCSLCIGHHGTCGCDWGHVVCCDGYDAYGCGCK